MIDHSEPVRSVSFDMQQSNNQISNMAYDESRYSFNATQESFGGTGEVNPEAGRNVMLSFGQVLDRLDPSASFPGLGELPSNGMDPAVEQNLTDTFTGDLNSTAYEVQDQDHSELLQEMLQQHPPPQPPRLLQNTQCSQVNCTPACYLSKPPENHEFIRAPRSNFLPKYHSLN